MNRSWFSGLSRNAVILGAPVAVSNSWKVGTTRTPWAWAAFVTAAAGSPTYSLYPIQSRSIAPLPRIPRPKKAMVETSR